MAGLRIRRRRESTGLPAFRPAQPGLLRGARFGVAAPSAEALGAFVWACAIAIVLLALAARIYNVNWDQNTHLHPDERHITIVANDIRLPGSIGEYFDTATSRLNPYNREQGGSFVYGTLPLFLTKAVAATIGEEHYDGIALTGRHLTALFDAATVAFVFLLGRRLFGSLAGLLGATFYASAPLAIQHAHFLVVDPYLTLFVVAALYFCVRIVQDGRPADYVLAGLAIGLGAACKLTALALLPVLATAVLVRAWPLVGAWLRQRRLGNSDANSLARLGLLAALALLAGIIAFRVVQPYAFDTPGLSPTSWFDLNARFLEDQRGQSRLLGGEVGFPPSVQWIDRTSYLYPLETMVRWGMGPVFGIAGWLAFAYGAFRLIRYRDLRLLLPVVFVLVYFGFMGRQFSLYLRYFLPLYPVLAVLAGFTLVELLRWAGSRGTVLPRGARLDLPKVAMTAAGLVVLGAVLSGLAYTSIYSRPVTRIESSNWMYATLPARSTIAVEHWDETIPMRLPGAPDKQFEVVNLDLYDLDTPEKVTKLVQTLDSSRYVVVSSRRLVNSIPRNPTNYPVTSRYYELLYNGELGFRLMRSFTSYPSLLRIEYKDSSAEESWTSYDHPPVLLFQKAPDYSRERLTALLASGPFAPMGLTPAQADRGGLLSTDDLAAQREGGTWNDVFASTGLAANYPTLLWLLMVEAAAFAVTPIAFALFRRLPDRGYLLSKPLGLLLLAYPVWLFVSLKVVDFDRTAILVWLGLLVFVAAAVLRVQRRDVTAFVRSNWRLILFSEALFLLAFFFFRELRLENPDLWHFYRGGEKPMDLAYLTAITRSTTLPPYDPWLAGGYINYYYLGQFFTATLLKAASIPPEIAYNLAVPTYFAFTAGAAFSVAYGLAAAGRAFLRRSPGFRPIPAWSPYAAGLLGCMLVAIAGNLDGVGQLVDRLTAVSPWEVNSAVPVVPAFLNSVGGVWQVVVHGAALAPFDFWRSSRMMPPTISITEFPYFSFLFADLHAHMMAIPFQLLTIGTALALALGRRGERSTWREWGLVGLLGLLAGSLRWLNSWDYPPFLMIALVAVLISERRLEAGAGETSLRVVGKAVVLIALSIALYQPFLENYAAPVSGVVSSPERTLVHQYLAHFGLFAAAIGIWLVYVTQRALRPSLPGRMLRTPARQVSLGEASLLFASLLLATVLLLLMGVLVAVGHVLVAVLLPVVLLVAWLAYRELRSRRPDGGLRLFVLALLGLALSLSIGVEFVTIKGDIQRMNTVFKFYLHIWVLFALVASFSVWNLVFVFWRARPVAQPDASFGGMPRPSSRGMGGAIPRPERQGIVSSRTFAVAGAAGLVALLLGALIYPVFATPSRLDDRFAERPRGLDGIAYMQGTVYDVDSHGPIDLSYDYEGIQWLRDNVEGTPAIVEGRSDLYRWGGRFSIYTGLPAVVGWDWHQRQQRGELARLVEQRNEQVDAFYSDPDVGQALRLIRRYGVEYVIVGRLERLYYPQAGLAKFESGLGGALEVAFANEELTIYRVRPSIAAAASP